MDKLLEKIFAGRLGTIALFLIGIGYCLFQIFCMPNGMMHKIEYWGGVGILAVLIIFVLTSNPRKAAQKILAQQKALYSTSHEYVQVNPAHDLPDVSLDFYNDTQKQLEAEKFKFLADLENVTLSKVFPQMRTFLRIMVAHDGAVVAAVAQIKNSVGSVDVETEFSDGTFLITALDHGKQWAPFPGIDYEKTPWDGGVGTLHARHRERLAALIAGNPDLRVVTARSLSDVLAMQKRQHALKCRHKADRGFVDTEDLRLATHNSEMAEEVGAELEKIKQEESSKTA